MRFGCADRKSPRGTRGRGKGKGAHAVRQGAAGEARATRVGAARVRVCMRSGEVPQGKARAVQRGVARARVRMRSGKMPQGKSPRGAERCGKGKGLKGEETGEKRKDNVEASDIAAAGSCQRSGRTFVPVYDLGGSFRPYRWWERASLPQAGRQRL